MRLKPDDVTQTLAKGLPLVWLITGDEPLLVGETVDAVRAAAREAGHTEREVLEADGQFDWQRLTAAADNLSLFGDRRIVELRLPTGKPGQAGGKAITDYCATAPDDTVLIITAPRLDGSTRKAAWVNAVDKAGAVVQIWPLESRELPGWLDRRMRAAGLEPTRDAVRLLAERSEGNLLAAVQEIEKLRLLLPAGQVDDDAVRRAVADSARFDVFDLTAAALEGNVARCVRITQGLRDEGVEPTLVLWALSREVRLVCQLHSARGQEEQLLRRNGVFGPRKAQVQKAMRRGSARRWQALLARCARVDRVSKGVAPGRVWDELLQLSVAIAGGRAGRRAATAAQ
ncbi:DNA polymerase III subunit delta [Aquisalimonas sp. 2447]|uniref:DNA polymerase III subunit delta n=1 Tax=Aquisalimonas sp. 2447 TaxID=2740807 RepID=UPI0014326635|nr:DNA polymerase III subunit delta [Aquisalimonas sp. 2447]QIT56327.1 DNA polymerase III subunit delta [Aquisalimonas sp. 2447]